jgi:hypothetical protein
MSNDLTVRGKTGNVGGAGGDAQPPMSPTQQASVAAVQKAVSSGQADDPKLKQDLQAVRNARTPEELQKAVHELRQDAKKNGIAVPHGHAAKAKGAKGAGEGELGPDDLNQAGDGLRAAQNASAGPQFGLNGAGSMFAGDSFVKKG